MLRPFLWGRPTAAIIFDNAMQALVYVCPFAIGAASPRYFWGAAWLLPT
jgi:hypothetical protein